MTQKSITFALMLLVLTQAAATTAATPDQIDTLTEKWLNLEQQARKIESNWTLHKPGMQQRIKLLKVERIQLQKLLQENENRQDDVAIKRTALLKQQAELEQQQQQIIQAITTLSTDVDRLSHQLPPLLQKQTQNSFGQQPVQTEDSTSEQLQTLLAKMTRLAEFNQRITLHEGIIESPDNQQLLVKQLYLGTGVAWFTSSDGHYSGWGSAGNDSWQWHFDSTVDSHMLQQAIAIYEKKQPAEFIRLPLKLPATSGGVDQ